MPIQREHRFFWLPIRLEGCSPRPEQCELFPNLLKRLFLTSGALALI